MARPKGTIKEPNKTDFHLKTNIKKKERIQELLKKSPLRQDETIIKALEKYLENELKTNR